LSFHGLAEAAGCGDCAVAAIVLTAYFVVAGRNVQGAQTEAYATKGLPTQSLPD